MITEKYKVWMSQKHRILKVLVYMPNGTLSFLCIPFEIIDWVERSINKTEIGKT